MRLKFNGRTEDEWRADLVKRGVPTDLINRVIAAEEPTNTIEQSRANLRAIEDMLHFLVPN